jgi:hypothetical protein
MIGLGSIAGLRIVEDASLSDPVEDWSRVRSPARAARRRRRGFPQRIVIRRVPWPDVYRVGDDMLVMHPATAAALLAKIERMAP